MEPPRSIDDYALLSDCQGSALVNREGSIDWACVPRFDSPSIFARLLDPAAGHWRIGPTGEASVSREYLPQTMVLRTRFECATGVVELTDAMVFGPDDRGHRIGHGSPHVIVRRLEGVSGSVECELDLTARSEYGLIRPSWQMAEGGYVARGGPQASVVSSDMGIEIDDAGDLRATVAVAEGDVLLTSMQLASPFSRRPDPLGHDAMDGLVDRTIEGWRSWAELHQSYRGRYADIVRFGGMLLQALTYAPTGAIVAAPTTSLPETIGGTRNWDYRYCWVRDASFTLDALWVAACPDEAGRFFDFLSIATGRSRGNHEHLQILYGVGGECLLPEHELEHLAGFAGSAPVRIGNGAWQQVQLDTSGELLGAASLLADQVGTFDVVTARFLVSAADIAMREWRNPDSGIWEIRGEPRHYVYSKLMCWVALDRAIAIADALRAAERVDEWTRVRDEIRDAIETEGWNESVGAFTQSFGSDALDASNLMLGITGFLDADDPRLRATVEAIARGLTDDHGLVFRYLAGDGLPGDEGTFTICSFWLVRALAQLGDLERAEALFQKVIGFANDLGLLAEEVEAATGGQLGNFPQAFTHIGLVNAAWDLDRARTGPVD
ncbi:MAG: Glucoamylase [Actinomycetia bacterium]|nr:Glucoamylase [Actinomycetes bacterium]